MRLTIFIFVVLAVFSCTKTQNITTDVLIIGGGASGTTAGIQSARLGVKTIIAEETPWLGGMLTSAGVSAIDGNYDLHSGLWYEFRQNIFKYYGGADSVKTGWVSNVLFEPNVGEKILSQMVNKEENLTVFRNTKLKSIVKKGNKWKVLFTNEKNNNEFIVTTSLCVDGTELGDVAKQVGIPYDIGMDSRDSTKEDIAPKYKNNIIQDLTYVAILKDFGENADVTIPKPQNYDENEFIYTCASKYKKDNLNEKLWDCDFMMKYGKLPNNYYMINWPKDGNDYYVNTIEMTPEERDKAYQKAKNKTLRYIYYLQNALGYKNLGIADDVYPTKDGLPFFPYHRESRRIKGLVQFTINDIAKPYSQETALYRTGIAVGNYPVDHHHNAYNGVDSLPDLHFYPISSFSIPLGSLIPKNKDNFIVAEKSISVSNIVNGTTRLQPVCLLIGQAAGTLAALSIKNNVSPKEIMPRDVQKILLDSKAYIMPYSDVKITNNAFMPLQRIGAAGILRGEGKNMGWRNHTYIFPDSIVSNQAIEEGLSEWIDVDNFKNKKINYKLTMDIINLLGAKYSENWKDINRENIESVLRKYSIEVKDIKSNITRKEFAILLDELVNPFEMRDVNYNGEFIKNK